MVMRARWRSFELPTKVEVERETLTRSYGKFIAEPFERGFGTTIGNSLRRVLLSSLEGAAVTHVKIDGALHEFSSLEGVLEDVTDIVLNVKNLLVAVHSEQPRTLKIDVKRKGEVTAADIQPDPQVEIINPELVIATLTEEVAFRMELTVRRGRGYVTAEENDTEDREIGVIPVDSLFSPVRRVRFRTENTRVGQLTDYDKLILEIWTNGTVDPEHALVEAGKILRKHLIPFVNYYELGERLEAAAASLRQQMPEVPGEAGEAAAAGAGPSDLHARPLSDLELSTRTQSALLGGGIATVGDLIARSRDDLLGLPNFGKKALEEVEDKLAELGLELAESTPTS